MLLSVVLDVAWRSITGRHDLLLDEVFRSLLFVMVALGLVLRFFALTRSLISEADLCVPTKAHMPRASTASSPCSRSRRYFLDVFSYDCGGVWRLVSFGKECCCYPTLRHTPCVAMTMLPQTDCS